MNEEKKVKPKQYTHIDYTAFLIYLMKTHKPFERAMEELEINIAKSTVNRNIKKLYENGTEEEKQIIQMYREEYLPNRQKEEFPKWLLVKINELPEKVILKKDELEDLYRKLSIMKEIVDRCNGNIAEAVRAINSGNTPLGHVKITETGLIKAGKRFNEVEKQYLQQKNDREEKEQ